MSRGFVKEDDQEEIPIVPPRADLPEGVTNYVTQVGMNELLTEKQMMDNEIEASKKIQTFQIVGVDEADISKGKISFTSPIARVLINKKNGDKAILKRGQEDLVFEIIDIAYH